MTNFRTNKPRPAGSVYDAITRAFGQIDGGVSAAAEMLGKSRPYVNAMSDADAEGKDKANMSLFQAGILAERGATSLAEWLAFKAGGVFIPYTDDASAGAIQDAIAAFSKESGEAVSTAIQASLKQAAHTCAVREIDEAISKLATLRSHMQASANVVSLRGEVK